MIVLSNVLSLFLFCNKSRNKEDLAFTEGSSMAGVKDEEFGEGVFLFCHGL